MSRNRTEYQLEVKLTIREVEASYTDAQGASVDIGQVKKDENGYYAIRETDGARFPLTRYTQWRGSGGNTLSVEDNTELGSRDFMGVMKVLGKMHEAIEAIGETK